MTALLGALALLAPAHSQAVPGATHAGVSTSTPAPATAIADPWWPPDQPAEWPMDWWEEDFEPRWPGLPGLDCTTRHTSELFVRFDCPAYPVQWGGTGQVGMAGSARAQQWVQMPMSIMVTHTQASAHTGRVDGTGVPPGASASIYQVADTWAWFVSPDGSTHNYGLSAPIKVRTVAFGSIPAEVTLQVSQLRDAEGRPMPLNVTTKNVGYAVDDPRAPDDVSIPSASFPVHAQNRLNVRVLDLQVDGMELDLLDECRTSSPANLTLTSPYLDDLETENQPEGTYSQDLGYTNGRGGTMRGTLDVPAFEGCRTASGDDLSPLVTATVSGPDNPVIAKLGQFQCFTKDPENPGAFIPPAPGADTPQEANCWERVPDNVFAPGVEVIPPPLPFPDHSPREYLEQRPSFPPEVPQLPVDHPGRGTLPEY